MSSDEEGSAKKRKIQRACDVCRKKKIRCDGAQMGGKKCSNCSTYNFECSYEQTARRRGPPKGYVESLETRLEKMEGLLKKLCPDGDFSQELGGRFDKDAWIRTKGAAAALQTGDAPSPMQLPTPLSHVSRGSSDDDDLVPSDDEVPADFSLSKWLQELQLNPAGPRFVGKSSGVRLVKNALALKHDLTGIPKKDPKVLMRELQGRRPEYWNVHPWERRGMFTEQDAPQHEFVFPESDLMLVLVDVYFRDMNSLFPLLHRPTFDRAVADGEHHRDSGFASVVLTVCAIASRMVRDPRVLLDGASGHSAGWKYFNQVPMARKSLLAPPSLYDVQTLCLATVFLQGSSAPQACWSLVGIGIRLAQDIGAHRRKIYNSKPSVQEELWKRAFWILVTFDRGMSSALGRPCAIQDEDFDLDLPIECDDEYWENPDPEKAFQQPEGKRCSITYFVTAIKLNQILAFALRTIYSINKSKVLLGFVGPEWEQNIVSELDSALNKWVDSVPDHLRWDPKREDDNDFHQSASLYAAYYQLQIAIHRPFIPNRGKHQSKALPALVICTNAARSCSHVVDLHFRRRGGPLPIQIGASFTSGIILLLNIWSGKRGGVILDPAKEMADVYRCMNILKGCETTYHLAGRFYDMLWELASVSELPLPEFSPQILKRDRQFDLEQLAPSPPAETFLFQEDTPPRHIAGSRRVYGSQGGSSAPSANTAHSFAGPPAQDPVDYGYAYPAVPQQPPAQHQQPQHWPTQQYDPASDPDSLGMGAASFAAFAPQFEQTGASWWPQTGLDGSYGAASGSFAHAQDPFGALDTLLGQGMMASHAPPLPHDALAMWANVPANLGSDDWSAYLMSMPEGTQSGFASHTGHP